MPWDDFKITIGMNWECWRQLKLSVTIRFCIIVLMTFKVEGGLL